ncbi:MAG TPA: riboflavin synthase [Roseiflexaceae bacterium]|nr:riboflavin synthase [Roseiflexaceae bacterium]
MFTGIVEEIGRVLAADQGHDRDNTLTIGSRIAREGARLGDSIAVNGVCLTVTALADDSFTVGTSPETLRRTNLGRLRPGDPVNLERSLPAGGRMGGHYVQGHVDDVGVITAIHPDGEARLVTFQVPLRLMPYIVQKGYVAVDGVSLTVASRDEDSFTVSLIAHTQSAVILGQQAPGAPVNLEVDIIAKYVESLLRGRFATDRSAAD